MIRNRVFILGAGVGKSCGYPLASELLKNLFQSDAIEEKEAMEIKDTIHNIFPSYNPKYENFPNVEDVLSLLDTLIELGDEDVERVKRTLLLGICKYLCKPPANLEPIESFAKQLTHGDFVITFNWDFSIEEAILNAGKAYKYFLKGIPIAYENQPPTSDIIITVLRPHGSIIWFSSGELKLKKELIFPLDETIGENERKIFVFKPLRFPNLSKEKEAEKRLPYIIPPSLYKKMGEEQEIMKIWNEIDEVLQETAEVWFIGYSLPRIDPQSWLFIRAGLFLRKNKKIEVKVINPDEAVIHRYNNLLGYGKFKFYPAYFTGELPDEV